MKAFLRYSLLIVTLVIGAVTAQAQVKVGNNPTTINGGSLLELESTNKGLLMPRISLTNTTTWGLTGTPAAGMHVYNTNTGITSTNSNYPTLVAKIGEYYWDGTGWVAIAPQGKTSSLIYAGFRANTVTLPVNNTTVNQVSTPNYDPFNGYSNGVYTIPFDGWYIISHMWRVKFNGPAGQFGSFGGGISVKPLSTGVEVARGGDGGQGGYTYTYAYNSTITMYLYQGDQVRYTVTPCLGCAAGTSYDMTDVYQTITAFQ
ncbi:hypothetical protein ACO2Q8_26810 [Larkinella sp. VNQ87]|uniref:hypothetical protein n=1 Tax=Larkinella sp. VNQ87 TaxID=3400921 RepID=UPI003C11FAC2